MLSVVIVISPRPHNCRGTYEHKGVSIYVFEPGSFWGAMGGQKRARGCFRNQKSEQISSLRESRLTALSLKMTLPTWCSEEASTGDPTPTSGQQCATNGPDSNQLEYVTDVTDAYVTP